jgi:hypothetical protein
MDLTIYTLTHKHFTKPDDNMYVPLQVGTAINSPVTSDASMRTSGLLL